MDSYELVLLDVWREACRHIEITESTSNVAPLLAQHLPLDCLIVRRLDLQHSSLRTVAVGGPQTSLDLPEGHTTCTAADMNDLLTWAGGTEILRRTHKKKPKSEALLVIPPQVEGDALVAPLAGQHGPAGALILVAPRGEQFADEHLDMLRELMEPFAMALENDHRLHEMAALREAAEADRRSLLNRLGRTELNDTVIGADSGLRPVMQRVELVSRSDAPVLILGETGTGKELVARGIHTRSDRAAHPFIRVNCGAIPPELIDSQLFGHERGSFTGAAEMRQGWFERADGGTLFLDEIGELPLAAQVRLLRVLQDGYIERVGGQQPLRVDVRIVAATHRDLASMVRSGHFREDLWYRIAIFPILLPPLRERKDDVPALARHFAERAATRFGLPLALPSAEDIHLLVSYHWPGNIRELGAVIDRAAILGEGLRLEVAKALGVSASESPIMHANHLSSTLGPHTLVPQTLVPQTLAPHTAASQNTAIVSGSHPTHGHNYAMQGISGAIPAGPPGTWSRGDGAPICSLDEAMRRHIELALRHTQGRIEGRRGAAALLQINPHTFRARMRKLGINWQQFRAVD